MMTLSGLFSSVGHAGDELAERGHLGGLHELGLVSRRRVRLSWRRCTVARSPAPARPGREGLHRLQLVGGELAPGEIGHGQSADDLIVREQRNASMAPMPWGAEDVALRGGVLERARGTRRR